MSDQVTTTQFNRKFISVYTCDLLHVHIAALIQIADCKLQASHNEEFVALVEGIVGRHTGFLNISNNISFYL